MAHGLDLLGKFYPDRIYGANAQLVADIWLVLREVERWLLLKASASGLGLDNAVIYGDFFSSRGCIAC